MAKSIHSWYDVSTIKYFFVHCCSKVSKLGVDKLYFEGGSPDLNNVFLSKLKSIILLNTAQKPYFELRFVQSFRFPFNVISSLTRAYLKTLLNLGDPALSMYKQHIFLQTLA